MIKRLQAMKPFSAFIAPWKGRDFYRLTLGGCEEYDVALIVHDTVNGVQVFNFPPGYFQGEDIPDKEEIETILSWIVDAQDGRAIHLCRDLAVSCQYLPPGFENVEGFIWPIKRPPTSPTAVWKLQFAAPFGPREELILSPDRAAIQIEFDRRNKETGGLYQLVSIERQ